MRIAAILVAAGSGQRFGADRPKQYIECAGKPVVRWAAERLAPHVAFLQPVGDPDALADALVGLGHLPIVGGGATRQDSVRAGLEALTPFAPDVVLIHDAARPYLPDGTIPALLAALAKSAGAIPAVPVADTLKREANGMVVETVARDGLHRAQTPQAFHFETILALHRDNAGMPGATDDAALFERAGLEVALVRGHEDNIKITYQEDAVRMARILAPALEPRTLEPRTLEPRTLEPRAGTGYDVHVLEAGRKLILCGIEVPHEKGLAGHSDADVGIHALCDAIYGALAEGDIGRHFPPSEATWKDADSARFLRHAAERIAARGGRLSNADITLICEQPKITPHAPAMIARIAELLGVDTGRVSIKATTSEKLGFTGRGEGIAAQAAVMLLLPA